MSAAKGVSPVPAVLGRKTLLDAGGGVEDGGVGPPCARTPAIPALVSQR